MAKQKTAFVCDDCGADYVKWQGQCSTCGAWNTLSEIRLGPESARRGAATLGVPWRELPTAEDPRRAALRALRPHQWVKNLLLFVPIALAHQLTSGPRLFHVAVAFASFCAVASAGYLLNDLFDLEADRQHPTKRERPFASGALGIDQGVKLLAGLLLVAFTASLLLLPLASTGMLALYAVLPGLIEVLQAWPRLAEIAPGWFAVMLVAELAAIDRPAGLVRYGDRVWLTASVTDG